MRFTTNSNQLNGNHCFNIKITNEILIVGHNLHIYDKPTNKFSVSHYVCHIDLDVHRPTENELEIDRDG